MALRAPERSLHAPSDRGLDFLRISPWQPRQVRDALRREALAWLLGQAEQDGAEKVIYINIDDSLGQKYKTTSRGG